MRRKRGRKALDRLKRLIKLISTLAIALSISVHAVLLYRATERWYNKLGVKILFVSSGLMVDGLKWRVKRLLKEAKK